MKAPYISPPPGDTPQNNWVRGGDGHISSRTQWISKLTVTHTRVGLLKEQPKYERVVVTSSVYLKKKHTLVFERWNFCLAGPGDTCLELSSSGGQITTSSTNPHQRGVCMSSDVSPLLENRWNPRLLCFLLFLRGYEFHCCFVARTLAAFIPMTAWLNCQLFINEFYLILWCLIPSQRH